MIYYTMIYSRIKYGICAYGFAKKENMDKVQILQNKLLKVLLEKKWRTPTNELHNKLDILLVNDIFLQEISSFVHNYAAFLFVTCQVCLLRQHMHAAYHINSLTVGGI